MANTETLQSLRRGQFNVIRDVGLTLASLAKRRLQESLGLDPQVQLELPSAEDLPESPAAVAICLNHVGVRNDMVATPDVHRVIEEASDGTLQEFDRRPPLWLDLEFLVAVYASTHKEELSLLGFLMRAFHDVGEVREDFVVGDSIHLEDRPSIDLLRHSAQEMARIWASFQQPYRPSFCVKVEARIDSTVKRAIRRVRESIVDFKKLDG